jgi:hypothetical protein
MEVKTIEGRDWGWDAGQYIGAVFHTARTIQAGVREDACVFISDVEINVYIVVDDIDMDSTDVNPFRQYSRHIDNLVASIKECETIAAKLHGSNLNTIDREIILMRGFARII